MNRLSTLTAPPLNAPLNAHHDEDTIPVLARWLGSWQISVRRRALSASELTRRYDRAAPTWRRMMDRFSFPDAYESLLGRMLHDEAPEFTGAQLRVLDCGVGTGALSGALARVLPTPFKLDAIDISPRMLELARGNLRDTGPKVTLRHGDVRKLPYDDGVFDLAMAAHVLEHLVVPSIALNEMVRVLKPGGLLVVCLTRRSPLGMYVHLKWRTHRMTPTQAEGLLLDSGLEDARCLSFNDRTFCRQLSMACIARKPAGAVSMQLELPNQLNSGTKEVFTTEDTETTEGSGMWTIRNESGDQRAWDSYVLSGEARCASKKFTQFLRSAWAVPRGWATNSVTSVVSVSSVIKNFLDGLVSWNHQ